MPETAEKKSKFENVDAFDYQVYAQHFPENLRPVLVGMFENQEYGWKSRARQVLKLVRAKEEVHRLEGELEALCSRVGRVQKSPAESARVSLRTFLMSLGQRQLEHVCELHNVSYASFAHDPNELVEAIIDEMLAV